MPEPRIGDPRRRLQRGVDAGQVLDRIPADFRGRITEVLVGRRRTARTTPTWSASATSRSPTDLPLEVIRHPQNLGYGGNQKVGYRWAIEHDLDIVVLLHGDGQYAPELLPEMVAPLERGEADAVFGSRMMTQGAARRGGMPLYKYVGNRILTTVRERRRSARRCSEWHSGYRAYTRRGPARSSRSSRTPTGSTSTRRSSSSSHEAGKRIVEIPIPTYYGDEICYVNGLGYARDVTRDVIRYRARRRPV